MTKAISQTLNMNPIQKIETKKDQDQVVVPMTDGELEEDLTQARTDIKEIAAIGIQAVAEAASLASQSQHDRLYLALSSVMKSTLDANERLIDVHRSRQELTREEETGHVTNQLFVGSTADLLEMLEKKVK